MQCILSSFVFTTKNAEWSTVTRKAFTYSSYFSVKIRWHKAKPAPAPTPHSPSQSNCARCKSSLKIKSLLARQSSGAPDLGGDCEKLSVRAGHLRINNWNRSPWLLTICENLEKPRFVNINSKRGKKSSNSQFSLISESSMTFWRWEVVVRIRKRNLWIPLTPMENLSNMTQTGRDRWRKEVVLTLFAFSCSWSFWGHGVSLPFLHFKKVMSTR